MAQSSRTLARARKQETVAAPPSEAARVGSWGAREAGVIDVAWRLYAEHGYENVSMAAVAKAAGLAEGTLYNYFDDKLDLVMRASMVRFAGHVAKAERVVEDARSLRKGLAALIAVQLEIILEAREIYRVWLREIRGGDSYRNSEARNTLRRLSNQFIRLLERFDAKPDPALGLTPAMMRDMVFGGVEHIGFTAIVQRRERELDIARTSAHLATAYTRAFKLG
jgi:AcrR family transcriptional regulator